MRTLLPALLMLTAAAAQAETYRWVEKINGVDVVHYSDLPREGADTVQITNSNVVATPARRASRTSAGATTTSPKQLAPFRYESCAITQPSNEQSLQELEAIDVHATLTPAKRNSDKAFFSIDGMIVPAVSMIHRISPIFRGEHVVSLLVRDMTGATVCQSPAVRFYVQQPGLLRPKAK